jgi:hypothetical protein
MSAEAIALILTALLALTGYVVKYLNDLRLAVRKDRLDRVNRQLSDLYGPLFALDRAGYRLWQVFPGRYGRDFWGGSTIRPPRSRRPRGVSG